MALILVQIYFSNCFRNTVFWLYDWSGTGLLGLASCSIFDRVSSSTFYTSHNRPAWFVLLQTQKIIFRLKNKPDFKIWWFIQKKWNDSIENESVIQYFASNRVIWIINPILWTQNRHSSNMKSTKINKCLLSWRGEEWRRWSTSGGWLNHGVTTVRSPRHLVGRPHFKFYNRKWRNCA